MDPKFAILLGGAIAVTNRLRNQMAGRTIIAADSGIEHARAMGLEVTLWVGDFDSASQACLQHYESVPRQEWSSDKDLTDGELAITAACERGAEDFVLVGAMGGRTDHSTNHLLKAFGMTGQVLLTSGNEEAMPVRGEITPDWPQGTTFSILAFDDLEGLSIEGAKWPLDKVSVQSGSGWTISNVVAGDLKISLKSGRAMAVGNFAL